MAFMHAFITHWLKEVRESHAGFDKIPRKSYVFILSKIS